MAVSGIGPYDPQNVFARILRGELPCKKVYEDEYALAFH
ncbi:MAG: histidine triad nucleotide-binding protein, partial [Komagataeibacter saccharivorans]